MSRKFYGSICVTDLIDQLKKRHSAFSKSDKNGKVYARVDLWLNDKEDQYGNMLGIQIVPSKERKETEQKLYIGNCKESEFDQPQPQRRDTNDLAAAVDDFSNNPASNVTQPIDDLPF